MKYVGIFLGGLGLGSGSALLFAGVDHDLSTGPIFIGIIALVISVMAEVIND